MKNNKFFIIALFFLIFLNQIPFLSSSYGPKIENENYVISISRIDSSVTKGDILNDYFEIENLMDREITISFSSSGNIADYLEFGSNEISIGNKNISSVQVFIKGKVLGDYFGSIDLKGDINEKIPVNISIVESSFDSPILVTITPSKKKFTLSERINFDIDIKKLKPDQVEGVSVNYSLFSFENISYNLGIDFFNVSNSFQFSRDFEMPILVSEGRYILQADLTYNNRTITNKSLIELKIAFFKIKIFGFFPMWLLFLILFVLLLAILSFIVTKKIVESKKKYKMSLDLKSLPQKTSGFFYLGKIAERNNPAYLDPLKMKTHSIIAGATGGGKSISAQVFIEEALINNVAVIVFDPTAQWSGMLRKCTDKRMLDFYPKFGLKESDAKGFKGNVRQIKDPRQFIEIKKYMNPGQIQIFSLNKLKPQEMDIFVANVVRGIFSSDPQETPDLKLLLVFDEVHRLLSKFGGSGEGFIQIERACREFRKWGIGVVLVSQVLADFVGEIKANISTEVQMRTRDEGDLNRIKVKYGEEFLQSLVKASVGVGMFVNPSYNHAKPYFINFRPILHNTRRLSDEELDKYNKYNDLLDDLDFQIEELQKEGIDVFDFNMELKLMKDKVMTGNFAVVDIYLEGLTPRVQKEWDKLGKKPKKRELTLVSEEEIKRSIEEAKKSRAKFEKEEEKKVKQEEVVKKEEKIEEKIVSSLTFDNGMMVSSLKELKDVIPNLDNEIFKIHVNEKKNDISKWIEENFSKEISEQFKILKTKEEIFKVLQEITKPKEVKKESGEKK